MLVNVSFGSTNLFRKDFPNGTTLGAVLKDAQVRTALQYGDNVQGTIGGVTQSEGTVLWDGASVVVQNRECSKA